MWYYYYCGNTDTCINADFPSIGYSCKPTIAAPQYKSFGEETKLLLNYIEYY